VFVVAICFGALLGKERASGWIALVVMLGVGLVDPVAAGVGAWRDHQREVREFREQPKFLHVDDQQIEGVASADRRRVTFVLPDGRPVTIGEPEGPWYGSETARWNLSAAGARGGVTALLGLIAYGIAHFFAARRAKGSAAWGSLTPPQTKEPSV
jgi:hypothetical protein